jgi:hypothetical protein
MEREDNQEVLFGFNSGVYITCIFNTLFNIVTCIYEYIVTIFSYGKYLQVNPY